MAECYRELGKTASAWAAFRDAAGLAAGARQADRERYASDRAKELEARLSRVTISVPAESRVEGLVIKRNGKLVPEALWNNPVPTDPGSVTLEASAPGYESWRTEKQLTEQQLLEVALPRLTAVSAAAPSPPPSEAQPARVSAPEGQPAAPRPDASHEADGSSQRTAGLVLGGAGLLLLGAGVYLYVDSRETFDRANCPDDRCVVGVGDKSVHDEGRTLERWAHVTGGVGLFALGAATYFLLSGEPEASATNVTAVPLPGGGAVNLRHRS